MFGCTIKFYCDKIFYRKKILLRSQKCDQNKFQSDLNFFGSRYWVGNCEHTLSNTLYNFFSLKPWAGQIWFHPQLGFLQHLEADLDNLFSSHLKCDLHCN